MTDDFLDPDKVDRERQRHGLTATEFAELAGIGRATWFRFLAGDGTQGRLTLRAIDAAYEKLRRSKRKIKD